MSTQLNVVTGGSGHIGANLVRALLSRNIPVRVLVHKKHTALDGLEVERAEGDVCDLDCLCRAFEGADTVYHLAAYISLSMGEWPVSEKINVAGTRNVVEACLRMGVRRLVHFSSIHSFNQKPFDIPVDESRRKVDYRACPPYDRSKAIGEREIRNGMERGLDAVIVNPTAIVGPYDYGPSHFGEALIALATGKLPALIGGGFDWVDVRDVVEGALQAGELAPAGSQYLLSGHWVSLCDLAVLIREITGISIPRLVCPLWLAPAGIPFADLYSRITGKRPIYTSVSLMALRSNRTISHERATRELGYAPREFRETIVDTLQWYRDCGLLDCSIRLQSGEVL
jgi:dihydroflavonol-4-reductase